MARHGKSSWVPSTQPDTREGWFGPVRMADGLVQPAKPGMARPALLVMDRGVPTEEVLQQMRASDSPVQYVVGTPKGRLTALESTLLEKPWAQARPDVRVNCSPRSRSFMCSPRVVIASARNAACADDN